MAVLLLLVAGSCGGGGGAPAAPVFLDVAAVAQLVFTGTIGPTFPGNATALGQVMQRNMGSGAAVGDHDGDGDLDVYLLGHQGRPNRLFRNDLDLGVKSFTDVTPPVLADLGLSRVAHFVDLDNDGDLDLLLVNDDDGAPATSESKLFRNDGGGAWTDVTAGSGFRPIGYLHAGCALADHDGDGLLDIYVTNWGMEGGGGAPVFPGSNRLFRNLGGFVFLDVTETTSGLGVLARDSFTAIFADFDGDLDPDLYVAVDHTTDEFYFNAAGVFTNATGQVGVTNIGNDMGVAPADFDDDGDLDLYSTNITDPTADFATTQFNVLYVNQLDSLGLVRFQNEAGPRGVRDTYFGWGVEWIDVENDGDLDLVAVSGFDAFVLNQSGADSPIYRTPGVCFRNDGTGNFRRTLLGPPDDSRCLVAFDYDRDGDLDLLVTNVGQPVRLLENMTPGQGRWLGVALRPDNLAIGATVHATIGAVTKRRDVIAGRSYLAGTPSEVHFGLGPAAKVDTLLVVWADGFEQVLSDVPADQLLRLSR